MAPAARLYRPGPPERYAGGRQLPDVVHQLQLRHDPCLWRHVRRTDAARADQVHGHVRGSASARGDACHDHAATGRLWHGPGHRAGRPACGDSGRDVLSRMAGVAAATCRPRRSGDSRRRVARPRSVGWHTYALVVEASRAGSNRAAGSYTPVSTYADLMPSPCLWHAGARVRRGGYAMAWAPAPGGAERMGVTTGSPSREPAPCRWLPRRVASVDRHETFPMPPDGSGRPIRLRW